MQFNNRSVKSVPFAQKCTTFNVGCAEIIYKRLRCPVIYGVAPFKQSIRVHLGQIGLVLYSISFKKDPSSKKKNVPQTASHRNIFTFPSLLYLVPSAVRKKVRMEIKVKYRSTFAYVQLTTPHN